MEFCGPALFAEAAEVTGCGTFVLKIPGYYFEKLYLFDIIVLSSGGSDV